MVTPGAAPLIAYAFRRVRRRMSTEAVPDRRRRTRRGPSTIRGATPDMTLGRPDADQAGARPYQHHLREHFPDMEDLPCSQKILSVNNDLPGRFCTPAHERRLARSSAIEILWKSGVSPVAGLTRTAITWSTTAKNHCTQPTGQIGLCSEDLWDALDACVDFAKALRGG
jgi:hypothetical protein